MLRYPLGVQTFEKIRKDECVYVDKTALIFQLVKAGKVYSLSRPRRFGKSLLVSTIKSYFEGRKDLFEGLAIEKLETEWLAYPVFHVDFNGVNFETPGALEERLENYVAEWEIEYGKSATATLLGDRFAYVLEQAHHIEKQQSQGRADCIVETPQYVYVFEFKLDGNADEVLKQIEDKGYAMPYAADSRRLFKIGASFSSQTGTISDWKTVG